MRSVAFCGAPLIALVGNPNCGKTALFNLLTGSRQKVANYAGVTVERKEGRMSLGEGRPALRILDLPGAYSLYPRSPDERVTADVLAGRAEGEKRPDLVVCVVDAIEPEQAFISNAAISPFMVLLGLSQGGWKMSTLRHEHYELSRWLCISEAFS